MLPLLLVVDLDDMANDILLAVIDVAAGGALVGLDPGVQMELEVFDEGQAPVENFVAMQTLEVELIVGTHMMLVPVPVSKGLPALLTEYDVRFLQVNCAQASLFNIVLSNSNICSSKSNIALTPSLLFFKHLAQSNLHLL